MLTPRLTGNARAAGGGVDELRSRLLAEIDVAELAALTTEQRRARMESVLAAMVVRDRPIIRSREYADIVRVLADEALGLGVLEPLLYDPSVTEIMINGPDRVYIERHGRIERVDVAFPSEAQLYQTIDRIVAAVNRRVDESSPMVDARLPGGERVNVVVPPLALDGPTVTIRRFPRPYTMDELIGRRSFDATTSRLLESFVRARLNIIISGGTGTGKTTLLNALSAAIPDHERIVTIEDAAELQLRQPHVVRLEARPANTEGRGLVTIRDLVRNSLRMRPDRIIVGEVRGGETMDMLQAMNTGHEGSLATLHANSTDDALVRLETLAAMSDVPVLASTVRDQITSAIDVVVQLTRDAEGWRRVEGIAALVSGPGEPYRLARVVAADEATALPHRLIERYVRWGEPLPGAGKRGDRT